MNVFMGIMTVLLVVSALIFSVGIFMFGMSTIATVYGCVTNNPEDRFTIGIDYGAGILKEIERVVDATERCVDISEQVAVATLKEYEDDEDDYIEL